MDSRNFSSALSPDTDILASSPGPGLRHLARSAAASLRLSPARPWPRPRLRGGRWREGGGPGQPQPAGGRRARRQLPLYRPPAPTRSLKRATAEPAPPSFPSLPLPLRRAGPAPPAAPPSPCPPPARPAPLPGHTQQGRAGPPLLPRRHRPPPRARPRGPGRAARPLRPRQAGPGTPRALPAWPSPCPGTAARSPLPAARCRAAVTAHPHLSSCAAQPRGRERGLLLFVALLFC